MNKSLWGALCAALLWGGVVAAQARAPDTNQEMHTGTITARPEGLPADAEHLSGSGEVQAETKPDTTKGTTYGNQGGAYTQPGYHTEKRPADRRNGNLGGTQAAPGHTPRDSGELTGISGGRAPTQNSKHTPGYADPSAPLERAPTEQSRQLNSDQHAYPNPASLNDERGVSPDNLNQNPGGEAGRDRSTIPPPAK